VTRLVAAPWVLTGQPGEPPLRDGAGALDGEVVVAVGPAAALSTRFGRAERLDAVLLPAMVNAHLHLELSHLAGSVKGGAGLPAWIETFVKARLAADATRVAPAMARAAAQLLEAGVAAVGDVSNSLDSFEALAAAGLAGTVFHEVFGSDPERLAAARQAARLRRASVPAGRELRVVESPHAVYSTAPAGLLELLSGPPASLHLAEDPAEREFVSTGGGPFAALRARMGGPPGQQGWGRSAVSFAAPLLGPGWLAVHVVDLDDADLLALLHCGATAVLCPRSNAHISRAVPPLERLLAAGVPLAIGTDSLASSPSLAPLAELGALATAFPRIAPAALLPLAWNGAAVGAPGVGRLAPGGAPGLLAAPLDGAVVDDPFRFLVTGAGPLGRRVGWLARHRPEVRSP
jgi:cytosine/adenosine deaminase-related metal-dependent hydrolase